MRPDDNVEIYQDAASGWRWRLVAANGETIADSSEAYVSKWNAERAAERVFGELSQGN